MALPSRSFYWYWQYPLLCGCESQISGEYNDRAVHCFFYTCIYRGVHYCLPIYFLGVLEICPSCPFAKRKKKDKGCHILGIVTIFCRSSFWLLYPDPFHG